jgi:hypothetical protein
MTACRCGAKLRQLNGRYYSPTAPLFFCDDDRTRRHEPATTPECVAVDKILRWDEVKEGDLALAEGVMMQVEQIYPADEERVVFRWSDGFTREHRLADLTAVTRYVETTDPDAKEA